MKRVLLCSILLAWSAMASTVVYKWVDAQGKIQYGDRPPDGVHAEVVELLGTHAGQTPAAAPAPKAAASGGPTSRETKNAVAQDVEQAREKQCAEAQDRYKKLIDGRHIYKTGPDGERQYLTSDELDAERVNAKRDIDATCDGST
jgi:hypothetical protein